MSFGVMVNTGDGTYKNARGHMGKKGTARPNIFYAIPNMRLKYPPPTRVKSKLAKMLKRK
jgi:hypothetical protein